MPTSTSSAQVFFDRIIALPEADRATFLRALINSTPPTFEEEWLDFKGASSGGREIPDSDVKKTWSTALSGFANTEGGVVVWGIDARKTGPDNIDAASGLSLVNNPAAFKSRLMQLHHESTDPPVLGVRVETITDPTNAPNGFVICLIPESPSKPHRADHCKNKPYYIRAGDDFVVPSPSLLRTLFFPHTNSHLWVEVAVTWEIHNNGPQAKLQVEARLHNSGTATAKDILVVVQGNMPPKPGPAVSYFKAVLNPQGHGLEAVRPLHPGAVAPLFESSWMVDLDRQSDGTWNMRRTHRINLGFLMYAADREPQTCHMLFEGEEIVNKAVKKGRTELGTWHRHIP